MQRFDDAPGDCLVVYPLVACRCLVMPGATASLYAPYQIPILSNGVCWLIIATEYTLFVTSHYDLIFTFPNQLIAKFIDTTCILFYTHSPYSLLYNASL